jgi:hypothetical protein
MSALYWPDKDPNEVLDYTVDWAARLDGDVIVTSVWTVPAPLVPSLESATGSATTVWLSGGVAGVIYPVLNRITTVAGRTMDQTTMLRVRDK